MITLETIIARVMKFPTGATRIDGIHVAWYWKNFEAIFTFKKKSITEKMVLFGDEFGSVSRLKPRLKRRINHMRRTYA